MVVLLKHMSKKVHASTLVEVLVASVLIIVIFSMASLTLNTLFKSSVNANTLVIENELNKLYYLYQHEKIDNNYTADFNHWELSILKQKEDTFSSMVLQAKNTQTNNIITKKLNHEAGQ